MAQKKNDDKEGEEEAKSQNWRLPFYADDES